MEEELVGAHGRRVVEHELSSKELYAAFSEVQRRGALDDPTGDCEPLLSLLVALGTSKADAHAHVLDCARAELLHCIPRLPHGSLYELLSESISFISIPELRDIPLACLSNLREVPSHYLSQLAHSDSLFRPLPPPIKRSVWKHDPSLLCFHAANASSHYASEPSVKLRNLCMDVILSKTAPYSSEDSSKLVVHHSLSDPLVSRRLTRRQLRASGTVRRLCRAVSNEPELLRTLTNLARRKFAETAEPSICSLRTQLVMALSENSSTQTCAQSDPDFNLISRLSTSELNGCIDSRTASEISSRIYSLVDNVKSANKVTKLTFQRRKQQQQQQQEQDGSGTISKSVLRALDTAANGVIAIRDPPSLHLILHEIIRRVQFLSGSKSVSDDMHIHRLCTALWFGLQANTFARHAFNDTQLDVDSARMNAALSAIKNHMQNEDVQSSGEQRRQTEAEHGEVQQSVESQSNMNGDCKVTEKEEGEHSEEEEGEIGDIDTEVTDKKSQENEEDDNKTTNDHEDQRNTERKGDGMGDSEEAENSKAEDLSRLISSGEFERKLILTYLLSKLAAEEVDAALPLLRLIVQPLSQSQEHDENPNHEASISWLFNEVEFMYTLARRAVHLVSSNRIRVDGEVWELAMRKLLIPACGSLVEVHEEVVRALSCAAAQTDTKKLADDVERTLSASEIRRNTESDKPQQLPTQHECSYDPENKGTAAGNVSRSSASSKQSGDSLVSMYASLTSKNKHLTESNAPKLHAFLRTNHSKRKR
jgi:hypothetical protein